MAYTVTIMPTAEEDLKKLSKELQRRFFNKIEKLKSYPSIHGKPLRYSLVGKWELKFESKWRIIYVIDEKEKRVDIEAIWHKDDF